MSKLLVLIGGAIVGVGVYLYLQQKKNPKKENDVDVEKAKEEQPMDKNIYSLENIIKSEEVFALGNLVTTELNESLSEACDKLIKILPTMNDDFPHAEVTFKLNEMANKIVPAKVNSFVAMDKESQESRKEEFKQDMAKLVKVAESADSIVRQTNLSKDERETLLIQIKY